MLCGLGEVGAFGRDAIVVALRFWYEGSAEESLLNFRFCEL